MLQASGSQPNPDPVPETGTIDPIRDQSVLQKPLSAARQHSEPDICFRVWVLETPSADQSIDRTCPNSQGSLKTNKPETDRFQRFVAVIYSAGQPTIETQSGLLNPQL